LDGRKAYAQVTADNPSAVRTIYSCMNVLGANLITARHIHNYIVMQQWRCNESYSRHSFCHISACYWNSRKWQTATEIWNFIKSNKEDCFH